MLALGSYAGLFLTWMGIGAGGCLGVMTTPVQILLTAVCSYITVALVCVFLQRIPRAGKWIVG